ncbi:MAG: MBL fold metallo-hydrolase [Candidatus Pacebacteria bacterium]|nr:MBL fold metallo-hydrolase [Candidatus Paceibacterota bacterium]MBP9818707.1 MBL fold metallo-hydrolase [Candidatus Paceibacterota bacterium]
MTTKPQPTLTQSSVKVGVGPKVHISSFGSIPLTNDGSKVELYCLGHGAMLSPTNTSYLAVIGKTSLLIDCGFTVPSALTRFGFSPASVSDLFITHTHGDHTGGLSKLLVQNRYCRDLVLGKKVSLWAPRIWAQNLWNHTLAGDLSSHDSDVTMLDGGTDNLKSLPSSEWYDIVLPWGQSSYAKRDVYLFEKGGLKVEAFRTMHTPARATSWSDSAWSTGLLINDSIWISSDTRFDAELVRAYAPRATMMIHDASPKSKDPVHASLDAISSFGINIKAKMWLSHLPHGFDDEASEEKVRSKGFRGLALAGTKFSVVV